MPYVGVTTRNGTCAICAVDFPKGTRVYFDCTKTQGKHLAHVKCWDDLKRERGHTKRPKKSLPAISTEPLDPPF